MRIPLFLLICLICLPGCKENPGSSNPESTGRITFSDLKVGQVSRYVFFRGDNYWDTANISYQYYKDTLIVEVISRNGSEFTIKEQMSPNSEVFAGGENPGSFYDSVFTYTVRVTGDSIFFKSTGKEFISILLGYPGYDETGKTFSLYARDMEDRLINIKGWKTDLPYSEIDRQGYTKNLSLLGNYFDRLNVIVDDSDMARDGAGKTIIYSVKHGIVRRSFANPWTNQGYGWDLI